MSAKARDADIAVLNTINASLREPVSVDDLCAWLASSDLPPGRATLSVTMFFAEIPLEDRARFLRVHHLDERRINAVAGKYGPR